MDAIFDRIGYAKFHMSNALRVAAMLSLLRNREVAMIRYALFGAAVLPFTFFAAPSVVAAPAFATQASDMICMGKAPSGGVGGSFTIVDGVDDVSTMERRGFAVEDCASKHPAFANYRCYICSFTNAASPRVRSDFESLHAVSPNELCKMAKQDGGGWRKLLTETNAVISILSKA